MGEGNKKVQSSSDKINESMYMYVQCTVNAMYSKPSSGCICKGDYICTPMLISALFTISKI